jgi:hypothetical protein
MERKMDIRFGTWNTESLCRPSSLRIFLKELAKYNLGLARGERVRLEKLVTQPADTFMRKRP